ncbi:MAG: DUF2690 domain-containing protein [Anaerolineae bacterium]|nr:YjfA family protein [Thermoflexales bacterium]MDW8406665.1 DUF2690 domain-containing protein [Anaerolineae bacterium]
MNTRRRSYVKIALVTCLGALLFLASAPASAQAGARCWGVGCRGKDPQVMRCNRDAITLAEVVERGARVELRYSPACNARWSRFTVPAAWLRRGAPYAFMGVGNRTLQQWRARQVWSLMWSGPIRACGGMFTRVGGIEFCTPAY